jgi:hypothetical protein
MEAWSAASRVGLAVAFCATFAVVVVLAGRDSRAQSAQSSRPMASPEQPPAAPVHIPLAMPGREEAGATEPAPMADMDAASVAELSRQAMPLDETTAEENEQRGDAIRRLAASPVNTQPLVYALRNDADIRNRILAIDGLRRAALSGSTDRTITIALTEASSSDDEVIASQAHEALADIERARPH